MAKNKQNKGFKGLKEPKMEKASIAGRTIKQKVLQAEEEGSTDHLSPVFSFVDTCPNHFQLADWQGQELKSLIDTMRDLGKLKWGEVRNQKGFKPVSPKTFSRPWPEYVSPE